MVEDKITDLERLISYLVLEFKDFERFCVEHSNADSLILQKNNDGILEERNLTRAMARSYQILADGMIEIGKLYLSENQLEEKPEIVKELASGRLEEITGEKFSFNKERNELVHNFWKTSWPLHAQGLVSHVRKILTGSAFYGLCPSCNSVNTFSELPYLVDGLRCKQCDIDLDVYSVFPLIFKIHNGHELSNVFPSKLMVQSLALIDLGEESAYQILAILEYGRNNSEDNSEILVEFYTADQNRKNSIFCIGELARICARSNKPDLRKKAVDYWLKYLDHPNFGITKYDGKYMLDFLLYEWDGFRKFQYSRYHKKLSLVKGKLKSAGPKRLQEGVASKHGRNYSEVMDWIERILSSAPLCSGNGKSKAADSMQKFFD